MYLPEEAVGAEEAAEAERAEAVAVERADPRPDRPEAGEIVLPCVPPAVAVAAAFPGRREDRANPR